MEKTNGMTNGMTSKLRSGEKQGRRLCHNVGAMEGASLPSRWRNDRVWCQCCASPAHIQIYAQCRSATKGVIIMPTRQ